MTGGRRGPIERRAVGDAAWVAGVVAPRTAVVEEGPPVRLDDGAGGVQRWCFTQQEGPLASYRRVVEVEPVPGGLRRVTQEVAVEIGLPPVAWLFGPPLRRRLARVGPERGRAWWLPPARLPRRAAVVLVTLCVLEVLVGYLADLFAYTATYAGSDLGAGPTAQGVALGVTRVAAVGAVVALVAADRRGRRPVLAASLVVGAVVAATGAVAPALWVLAATQVVAGTATTAAAVLIGVMAVEEVPAGARAWSVGVIGMCFGLGSGVALAALPLAGTGRGGWRALFALALVVAPAAAVAVRWLPETRPFTSSSRRRVAPSPHTAPTLLLLGSGAFLLALFADPGGALQGRYLRTERHLSALEISVLLQVAGTIGGLGTLIGGRLADTRGRRPVAAAGALALAASTVAAYASSGAALWVWEVASSTVSYGVGPALAVYGAELFPTAIRSRAGGALTAAGAAGGLVGLVAAGVLSSALGSIAPALAVLAVGPVVLTVLVATRYPETASRTLEDLNPTDRPVPPGPVPAPPATPGPPPPPRRRPVAGRGHRRSPSGG